MVVYILYNLQYLSDKSIIYFKLPTYHSGTNIGYELAHHTMHLKKKRIESCSKG